jgi:uncharacterized DUF497 family protein
MDVSFTLNEIDFKWDGKKGAANLRKHKVSFESACEVFFDPFVYVLDAGAVEREQREAVIDMTVSWRLLYVVYIENDDVIRIISARLADKAEREAYENR